MCSVKPLDKKLVAKAAETGLIVTAEDHNVNTGLGTFVAAAIAEAGKTTKLKKLGVTQYGGSGKPADLFKMQGVDAQSIAAAVLDLGK
jgi:transketolase